MQEQFAHSLNIVEVAEDLAILMKRLHTFLDEHHIDEELRKPRCRAIFGSNLSNRYLPTYLPDGGVFHWQPPVNEEADLIFRSIREIVFKVNADVPVSHFRLCTNGFNPCTDMYIIPIKGFPDWLTREPKISKEDWRLYTTYEEL